MHVHHVAPPPPAEFVVVHAPPPFVNPVPPATNYPVGTVAPPPPQQPVHYGELLLGIKARGFLSQTEVKFGQPFFKNWLDNIYIAILY